MTPRRIVFIAFEDVQALDVIGPWEVFSQANRGSASDHYAIDRQARSFKRPAGSRCDRMRRLKPVAVASTR